MLRLELIFLYDSIAEETEVTEDIEVELWQLLLLEPWTITFMNTGIIMVRHLFRRDNLIEQGTCLDESLLVSYYFIAAVHVLV